MQFHGFPRLVVLLLVVATAAQAQSPSISLRAVDRHFSSLQAAGQFNGLVLVGRGDRLLFQRTYGLADFEQRTPLGTGSIFRIGSLTKPVTAGLVLSAVAQERLTLADRLCERVDFCLPSWSQVTLEQLLSHSSGIPDHFGDLNAVPVDDTVAEVRRAISTVDRSEALRFAPGTSYAYSNFNYVLAAAMLEQATGRTWRTAIRELAENLRALSLDYDEVRAIVPGRARGYDRTDGAIRNIDYDDHAAHAAGGLRATGEDFFRWSRAVLQARLFPASLRDNMLTPRHGNYGLGWQIRTFHGRRVYNHTGGIDGFSTHIAYYPDEDVTVIVFTNIESDAAILFACDAAAFLFGIYGRDLPRLEELTAFEPRRRCGVVG